MSSELQDPDALVILKQTKLHSKGVLLAHNDLRFEEGERLWRSLADLIGEASMRKEDEHFLNEMFVVKRYADLIAYYGTLWSRITAGQFSKSWSSLHDCLDMIRLIKRFSLIDVSFFEDQLLQLEPAYPYSVFFSVGLAVGHFECSICHKDIDGEDCPHLRHTLYNGVLAVGVARGDVALDHVSMVKNPQDKRCVAAYEDDSEHFKLVRYLASRIRDRSLKIFDFNHIEISTRTFANPDYKELGRNQKCFCESDKKFKQCCLGKTHREGHHAEIYGQPVGVEQIVK